MSSLILAKSNYIYSANTVYSNLKDSEEYFYYEALIVSYAKCELLYNSMLDDFYIDGIYVEVEQLENEYNLYFLNYKLNITVLDNVIIDFFISSC